MARGSKWIAVALWGMALGMLGCDRPPPPPEPSPPPGPGGVGGLPVTPGGDETPTPTPTPGPGPGTTTAAPGDPRPAGPRHRAVASDHPLHDRFEGTGFANACKSDDDCQVGGCSGEVCSAEAGVNTTCEALPMRWPTGTSCGCVDGSCVWWNARGQSVPTPGLPGKPPPANDGTAPKSGPDDCGGKRCKPGQQCISYFGIAGPRGPQFHTCGIRCKADGDCPAGQRCVTIADGPGPICQ